MVVVVVVVIIFSVVLVVVVVFSLVIVFSLVVVTLVEVVAIGGSVSSASAGDDGEIATAAKNKTIANATAIQRLTFIFSNSFSLKGIGRISTDAKSINKLDSNHPFAKVKIKKIIA